VGDRKYSHFDVGGKVFIVTGGAQGLGFSIAEGLVEAGGTVHVLDRASQPTERFKEVRARASAEYDGGLEYHEADITNADLLGKIVADIAARKKRLDGLVAGSWSSSPGQSIEANESYSGCDPEVCQGD
jgi:NAD(P)-dependent dehydrogenase (short-subunit alcohol dehydrogenase family)